MKKTGKMYNSDVLFEWKHKYNADIDFFIHALAMFSDQNQKNWSKIDDLANNTSKFGHKTQKNVNNFQNTWNFKNSMQTKMS